MQGSVPLATGLENTDVHTCNISVMFCILNEKHGFGRMMFLLFADTSIRKIQVKLICIAHFNNNLVQNAFHDKT